MPAEFPVAGERTRGQRLCGFAVASFQGSKIRMRTSADAASFDGRAMGLPLEAALVGASEDAGELHATVDVTTVAATMATLPCCKPFIAN